MVSSGSYPLYDFLMREYHPTWGRWISPDPAGLAAANPANPQTWNRYAYALNNPTTLTDPLGLYVPGCDPWTDWGCNPDYPLPLSTLFLPVLPPIVIGRIGGGGGGGNASGAPGNPRTLPQAACSDLSLNDFDTFWNQNFATPQQVNSFFRGQPKAPGSWNGASAAQQFINEGINPGLAVGIVGAETSFGNGSSLSATNIGNPFSCAIGRISNFNGSATCAAQTAFNDAFAGKGGTFLTPLSALVAGHYTTTQTLIW